MPSSSDAAYPPLDRLKPIAEDLWIVDSGPIGAMGLAAPIRMTVVRLANGGMWLHSPTRYDDALRREIEAEGPIRHLVAPNIAHWMFVADWQSRCPEARTWAGPGLRERAQVKKSRVRLDFDLSPTPPAEWAADFDQLVFPGGLGYREVAFWHRSSRALILTDLVQNLEPDKLTLPTRLFARLAGSASPGGTPAYLRLAARLRKRKAKAAANRMLAWNPDRVIFAHGAWFERDAAARLRRALQWLID